MCVCRLNAEAALCSISGIVSVYQYSSADTAFVLTFIIIIKKDFICRVILLVCQVLRITGIRIHLLGAMNVYATYCEGANYPSCELN